MVRLLVLLAPAFAVIAGIGIVTVLKPFNTLLHEVPQAIAKSKRKLPRVSKEYSGVVVFIVFLLLMSNLAFSPQTGGMPRSISGAFVPTAISSSSIPVGGAGLSAPVRAWLDAIDWMHTNVASSTVIDMWWDYGNWLADLGNVTSLADNTTVNSTQIENVGYTFMATENQSLTMLNSYGQNRVKYIAVFTVLVAQQTSSGWVVSQDTPYQYGDDGKWTWMASISGQAKQRFIDSGLLTSATAWTNQNDFGSYQSNTWVWNDKGLNCTVKELLNYALVQYCNTMTSLGSYGTVSPDLTTTQPTYLHAVELAGLETPPNQYGGFVPIVAIYSIDWAAWDAAHSITPPSS